MPQSVLKDVLPADYGYVILVAAGGSLVNVYLMRKVMEARKKFEVKYPVLYSADNEQFNCIQRSHQNYLEGYPFFAVSLLVGGLQNPKSSALVGAVCLVSRILYARGYSTGDPAKRVGGAVPWFAGSMYLLGNMIYFGMVHSGVICRIRAMFK